MKVLTVTGGHLYQLAMIHLQDATQFTRIIQSNYPSSGGLPMDPFLSGLATLNIPSINPQATGGILIL